MLNNGRDKNRRLRTSNIEWLVSTVSNAALYSSSRTKHVTWPLSAARMASFIGHSCTHTDCLRGVVSTAWRIASQRMLVLTPACAARHTLVTSECRRDCRNQNHVALCIFKHHAKRGQFTSPKGHWSEGVRELGFRVRVRVSACCHCLTESPLTSVM